MVRRSRREQGRHLSKIQARDIARRTQVVGLLLLLVASPCLARDWEHALLGAARRRDAKTVETLLAGGAPADVRGPNGRTPLHLACLRGDRATVKVLLAHGADPNLPDAKGAAPLLLGAGDSEVVRLLLSQGAQADARSDRGNSPLMAAAAHPRGEPSVVLLIDAGADVRARNVQGTTALARAAFSGTVGSARRLLDAGAIPDDRFAARRGLSILSVAAERSSVAMVELLLSRGADPNLSDGNTGHALNRALATGRSEIARLLLQAGADPTRRAPLGQVPPLLFAASSEFGDTSIARLLIDGGAELDSVNSAGESAVAWARRRGDQGLASWLLQAGATEPTRAPKSKEIPSRPIDISDGGHEELASSIIRSLELLQKSSNVFLDNRGNCVSCHHQNLPSVALGWARDRGFLVDEPSLERMVQVQLSEWRPGAQRAYEMESPVGWFSARLLGWGLLGFSAIGYPPDEITDAAVWYLAATQRPDGHWVPGVARPPLGGGSVLATVLALRALQLYPPEGMKAHLTGQLKRARHWLENTEPRSPEERALRALGLAWTGSTAEELRSETGQLLRAQRDDGGWAQLPGMSSDAWATGQTLVVLALAGGVRPSDAAYQRGLEFLLRTEFADGSWFVARRSWRLQPHFDSEFPHGRDQWISAAGTAWATMAMLLAVEEFRPKDGAHGTPSRVDGAPAEPPSSEPRESGERLVFEADVLPLLSRSCTGCHSGARAKASLDLRGRAAILRGGESGRPAVLAGRPEKSPLYLYPAGRVEDMQMPPRSAAKKYPALSPAELETIRNWIQQGADFAPDAEPVDKADEF